MISLEVLCFKKIFESSSDKEKFKILNKLRPRCSYVRSSKVIVGSLDYNVALARAKECLYEVSTIRSGHTLHSACVVFLPKYQTYFYQDSMLTIEKMKEVHLLNSTEMNLELTKELLADRSRLLEIMEEESRNVKDLNGDSITLDVRYFIHLTPQQIDTIESQKFHKYIELPGKLEDNRDFILLLLGRTNDYLSIDPDCHSIELGLGENKLIIKFIR